MSGMYYYACNLYNIQITGNNHVCHDARGKNSRPAYDKIGGLRALTKAPFICLTATAPPEVRSEISERLHLEQPVIVLRNLDRRNIFYSVSTKSGMEVCVCHCAM